MKTFKMAGMAAIAILMSLTSCSKENGPENNEGNQDTEGNEVVVEKKLIKFEEVGNGWNYEFSFKYNDKGRLTEANCIEVNNTWSKNATYKLTWADNAIKINYSSKLSYIDSDESKDYNTNYTLYLTNGLVQNEDNNICTYNASNRLIEFESKQTQTTKDILWDGDKLVYISNNTFEYNDGATCKNGYTPLFPYEMDFANCYEIYIAHPELIGMKSSQLPTTIIYAKEGYAPITGVFKYEFDSDGYVTKITKDRDDNLSWTYILTWK